MKSKIIGIAKTIFIILIILLMFCIKAKANQIYAGAEKQIEESTKYIFLNEKEIEDVQKIAIAEAYSEGLLGMAYVMHVIYNRLESDQFPNTIEGVIAQDGQFECITNGSYEKAIPDQASKNAYVLSLKMYKSNALYFENNKGKSDTWHNNNLDFIFKYRNHSFYK